MNIKETYLELLRAACFGKADEGGRATTQRLTIDPADLKQLLHLCRIHGTGPLVYNELLKTYILPPETQMQMKQVCMQNMLLQSQWEQIIVKVWKCLQDAVLMKGFAYARHYPLPYLRAWGDLDVWVGPEQYHQACGVLREAFPEAKHHDEEWDELKHYCFVFPDGKAIELHRVSMDFLSPKDQRYWCELEKKASGGCIEVGGIRVPVFDANFDMLFCFMHSWEHFCGTGIPLKQVCDIALLVRGQKPDTNYLETHLKALGMLEVWKAYGYMVCRTMGMAFAEWPLGVDSKYGERLYRQVLDEGQCRKKDYGEAADRYEARENARKMNILARKWLTLTQRIEKARFMYYFAPRYACHVLWQEVKKGIRRTIRREEMINY